MCKFLQCCDLDENELQADRLGEIYQFAIEPGNFKEHNFSDTRQ